MRKIKLTGRILQLTEVEYLIDQTEKILSVTIDDAQCLLHISILYCIQQTFYWCKNESKRCAQVVTDIGKELQLHVVHLLLTQGCQSYFTHFRPVFLSAVIVTISKISQDCQDKDIEKIAPC